MTDLVEAVAAAFRGTPEAPPPLGPPTAPPQPPDLPPATPPDPPLPPLIVCPPAAPPPLAPPGFEVWAAQIPSWFWLMFVFMAFVACLGTVAIVYILRELRQQRKGQRLPGTEMALEELSRQVTGRRKY